MVRQILDIFLKNLYQANHYKGLVIKRFNTIRSLKWLPAKLLLLGLYPYALNPLERTAREVVFFISREKDSPRVRGWGPNIIIREYLFGRVLTPKDYQKIVNKIIDLHEECWRLGDTKYDNFIEVDGKIMIIDAEQSVRDCSEKSVTADLVVLAFFLCLSNWPVDKDTIELLQTYDNARGIKFKYFIHPGVMMLFVICPRVISYVLKQALRRCIRR